MTGLYWPASTDRARLLNQTPWTGGLGMTWLGEIWYQLSTFGLGSVFALQLIDFSPCLPNNEDNREEICEQKI